MEYLINLTKKKHFYLYVIIALSLLSVLPWLALGNFYTRGEPREALVAMAMLQQGNFILPEFQGEIAFKPPFLHWLVALFSKTQGYISEFTSRLPSALAACAMFISFFSFMSKRMNVKHVFLATLLLMSCFEIHRAAMTCRVDMLLTSMIVLSLLCIYKWSEKEYKALPVLIPLFISGAILTKGPIGVILPCFILFVFMLLQKEKFTKIIITLVKIVLSSAILPLCWYIAAYHQAGDTFLTLFMEENFGRFLGKMTYESHENGAIYNVWSLLAGLLPWTLLVLFSLFTLKYKKIAVGKKWLIAQWNALLAMDKVRLFSLVAAVCVFVFYCIPKSKRSVYIMPMYPFTCIFLADYFYYLYQKKINSWNAFAITLSSVGVLLAILLVAIHRIDLSNILSDSHSSQRIIMQMGWLQDLPLNLYYLFFVALLLFLAYYSIRSMRRKSASFMYVTVFIWFGINFALDGLVIPSIKNGVPDYYLAQEVNQLCPEETIYSYRPVENPSETLYVVSFYLNDRIEILSEKDVLPDKGHVLVREEDKEYFERMMGNSVYKEVYRTNNPFTTTHRYILFYEFEKK